MVWCRTTCSAPPDRVGLVGQVALEQAAAQDAAA
jgi:hypothetical protein